VLEEMRIRGLGVIDDAVLELGPGLTVVTGETGAGKTMVVQGLGLLFGGRADAGRVRPGADRAVVEGRLVLDAGSGALERAVEAGAELDDGALLVSRSVGADGRSRAHVGGRAVPVGVLGELAERVLAVHGQSDQQRLLKPAEQRAALDRFAGEPVTAPRVAFGGLWRRRTAVLAELDRLRTAAAERAREAELLRLGLAEVEAAAPQPGEGRALAEEIERLANADDLRAAAATAQQALTGDEQQVDDVDALALVTAARRALEGAASYDPALRELAGRVAEAAHLLADAAGDLASYAASVDADPARLSAAQDRLAVLTALVRRHAAADVDGVLAWAESAAARLGSSRATTTASSSSPPRRDARGRAGRARGPRSPPPHAPAERLGAAVGAELAELAMPHAQVAAVVSQREQPAGLAVGGGAGRRARRRRRRRAAARPRTRAPRRDRCTAAPPAASCRA
jgi:DNA repair protein RecN (Recombination protein N)